MTSSEIIQNRRESVQTKRESGIVSLETEPRFVEVKTEPGAVRIKIEPGLVEIKTEPEDVPIETVPENVAECEEVNQTMPDFQDPHHEHTPGERVEGNMSAVIPHPSHGKIRCNTGSKTNRASDDSPQRSHELSLCRKRHQRVESTEVMNPTKCPRDGKSDSDSCCSRDVESFNSRRQNTDCKEDLNVHSEPRTCMRKTSKWKCPRYQHVVGVADKQKHNNIHPSEKTCKCSSRPYKSTGEDSMFVQERTHSAPHRCSMCPYSCTRRSNMTNHEMNDSYEKLYICSVCHYSTRHRAWLNTHENIHSGIKPYKCSMCQYSSVRKRTVEIHERTHTGEKPYACSLCPYTAARKSTLGKHESTHTHYKPQKCPLCPYKAGDKPHKCPLSL